MKGNLVYTFALLLTCVGSVHAADPLTGVGSPTEISAGYDTVGDGVISEAEKAAISSSAETERRLRIAKYDVDGDGALNAKERAAMQAELTAARLTVQTAKFAALDVDGSGSLSLMEFAAGAPTNASAERVEAAFARMDANGDSVLTLAEFTAKPVLPDLSQPPGTTSKPSKPGARKNRGAAVASS